MSDDKQKKFRNKKFSLRLPSFTSIKLGGFGSFKLPVFGKISNPFPTGLYLGGGKLIVISLGTVALGFIASLFLLMSKGEQEITWPMTGAVYEAPSMVGARVVDEETPMEASQTLQINLPGGIRLDAINLVNISLGKAALATAFQIAGTSTAYIVVDDLIIKNSEFPSMDFANSEFYTINATTSVQAAGHTFNMTATTTIADITVGSGRGVASYDAKDMIVDRIIIECTGSSDCVIDTITIDGVKTWIGVFDLDYVKAGTLTLENMKVGDDGDIDSADLVMNSTVYYNNVADGVVEAPINIK
jgi:hypothetical protein